MHPTLCHHNTDDDIHELNFIFVSSGEIETLYRGYDNRIVKRGMNFFCIFKLHSWKIHIRNLFMHTNKPDLIEIQPPIIRIAKIPTHHSLLSILATVATITSHHSNH